MRTYLRHYRENWADFRRYWLRGLLQWGLWWLTFSTFSMTFWIRRKFGAPTFDQFLFHLQLGFHGLLNTEYYVIKSFVVTCALLPGLAAGVVSSGAVTAVLPRRPGFDHLGKHLFFPAPAAGLLMACLFLLNQVSFFPYLASRRGRDYFSAHYQNPKWVKLTGKNPRNLVLIYVESLDDAYGNAHLFGKNLLHNLDAPARDSLSFGRYNQAPGTGWTIAAIVSTQCGVPLEPVTVYDGNTQGEKLKHFLPDAVCLGDVLNEYGYHSVFMGGFTLDFAG
jgi:phosphoglycerol transferase